MLLTEPLLSCPGCVFQVVVMLEDPATTHLQCCYCGKEVVGQDLAIHGPIHPPLNTVQSSCLLCRKAPPKNYVSTSMLHGWDGVLGVVLILLLPPNMTIWIMQMVIGKLQTSLDMCWLEQGDLACAAGFGQ